MGSPMSLQSCRQAGLPVCKSQQRQRNYIIEKRFQQENINAVIEITFRIVLPLFQKIKPAAANKNILITAAGSGLTVKRDLIKPGNLSV